jgi:NADP-dependent 3-hydroxy acid dehydrogenase YdfG
MGERNAMSGSGILQGKRAVVFRAGGSIGAAVAKEFAAEGAEVFLSGRTRSNVEEVKRQISGSGGVAHAAVVDALDDAAVQSYVGGIVREAGGIDVEFNAVGPRAGEYGNEPSRLGQDAVRFAQSNSSPDHSGRPPSEV